MGTRTERKRLIAAEVKEYKEQRKARRAEIAALPQDEQKAARAEDRAIQRDAKTARKNEIKQMSQSDRRAAKRHDRTFRKIKNRPRRAVFWGAVACLLVFVFYQVSPLLGGIANIANLPLYAYSPEGEAARANARIVAEQISDEGIVLMKNDNNSLPLAEMRLNVFGTGAFEMRHGGGGSGGANMDDAVSIFEGLTAAGIAYNRELHDITMPHANLDGSGNWIMDIAGAMVFGQATDEPDVSYLTDEVIAQARAFSSNAMIAIASQGVEASDFTVEELRLSPNRRALIEKVSANFDNVIIVVNAGNTMELGFIDEFPAINAALWIGMPGPFGANSLGRILSGEVNPSGRLVNTWVYDVSAHPAYVNFGNFRYDNLNLGFLNYEEGIYVGYRFFETFYLGNEEGYRRAVQFPFGFGLSYTEFEWELSRYDLSGDTISLWVRVTNTGDRAGKDVVQVYFSAPFTPGGIEKSAIELAGYVKTQELAPGESEIVAIEFSKRDMASYDYRNQQAFVLEAGVYEIMISRHIRHAVESLSYEIATTIIFREDAVTGTAIRNRFDYAHGDLTYLSRSDWAGTFPNRAAMNFAAPQHVVDTFNSTPARVEGARPITGANNGIMLADLKGLDFHDPMWERFLDQFTLREMDNLVTRGAYKTFAIERLGVPEMVLLDGPAGINPLFSSLTAASYPTAIVVASTWNDELAFAWGYAVGREAAAYGVHGWYAPGMNIHRSPFGGRNFEYFSEDPLLSGRMSAAATRGAQSHNILVFMKHFALNDQEVNARSGVIVWTNEQALREIYLRPFEITVKEGSVTAVMSSFIHIGPHWSGGNRELLQYVLRDEWGFVGLVSTDAVLGDFMDVNLAIRSGNDLMLNALLSRATLGRINRLYRDDPVGVLQGLRNSTHNITYTMVNHTNLF